MKSSSNTIGNMFIVFDLVIFMAIYGLTLGPIVWILISEII